MNYSTITQSDETFLNREVKLSLKTILGAAAFVSFVIGSLAVVALAPSQHGAGTVDRGEVLCAIKTLPSTDYKSSGRPEIVVEIRGPTTSRLLQPGGPGGPAGPLAATCLGTWLGAPERTPPRPDGLLAPIRSPGRVFFSNLTKRVFSCKTRLVIKYRVNPISLPRGNNR